MLKLDRWAVLLIAMLTAASVLPSAEPNGRSLFDGQSLEGWDGDPRFWRVENGELIGETTSTVETEKNTFLVYRGGEVSDFDLRFEYQIRGGNSGIQYRSVEKGPWSIAGYQSDFEDRYHPSDSGPIDRFTGMFFEEQGRMFMGQRGQAVVVRHNPKNAKKPLLEVVGTLGDSVVLETAIDREGWNEMRVIARGYTFVHIVNGKVLAVAIDEDLANRRAEGLLAFQLHAGPPMQIRIRNMTLRDLSGDGR